MIFFNQGMDDLLVGDGVNDYDHLHNVEAVIQ